MEGVVFQIKQATLDQIRIPGCGEVMAQGAQFNLLMMFTEVEERYQR